MPAPDPPPSRPRPSTPPSRPSTSPWCLACPPWSPLPCWCPTSWATPTTPPPSPTSRRRCAPAPSPAEPVLRGPASRRPAAVSCLPAARRAPGAAHPPRLFPCVIPLPLCPPPPPRPPSPPQTAFTMLSLFNVLRFPLVVLPKALRCVSEAFRASSACRLRPPARPPLPPRAATPRPSIPPPLAMVGDPHLKAFINHWHPFHCLQPAWRSSWPSPPPPARTPRAPPALSSARLVRGLRLVAGFAWPGPAVWQHQRAGRSPPFHPPRHPPTRAAPPLLPPPPPPSPRRPC